MAEPQGSSTERGFKEERESANRKKGVPGGPLGAVRIDGTARPQLVRAPDDPSSHRIIAAFLPAHRRTDGDRHQLNRHKEPIVYSPLDAIRAFGVGDLDHLAIGDYLVRSPSPMSRSLEPLRRRARPSPALVGKGWPRMTSPLTRAAAAHPPRLA